MSSAFPAGFTLSLAGQAARDFSTGLGEHHAAAPTVLAELIIVVVGVIITALVAYYTLKYLIRPGEKSADHVKRRVLRPGGERREER